MEIDIEQLIIEVSTFPELWDLSNENYKNKNKREEAWLQIITRIYGDFVENKSTLMKTIIIKWKTIKDAYVRSRKKIKNSSGATIKKKYRYANLLTFLEPVLVTKETASANIDTKKKNNVEDQMHEENSSNSEDSEEVDKPTLLLSTNTTAPTLSSSTPVAGNQSCCRKQIRGEPQLEPESWNYLNVVKSHLAPTLEEDNDDLTFFKSLLPALKEVPLHKKLQFRITVMTVLQDLLSPASNVS